MAEDSGERLSVRTETLGGDLPIDGLRTYMRDLSHYPLLEPEEEKNLARIYQTGRQAKLAWLAIKHLTGSDEDAPQDPAVKRLIRDGEVAGDKLIVSNARWVVKIAQSYANKGLSIMDIIQNGNIGLMEAAAKFDPERGTRLSTYATPRIHRRIQRGFNEQSRTIRVAKGTDYDLNQVLIVKDQLYQELGQQPSVEEIAGRAFLKPKQVRELLAYQDAVSLSAPAIVTEEGTAVLEDTITDPMATDPEINAMKLSDKQDVVRLIAYARLRKRQYEALRLSLKKDERGEYLTEAEIGERMGVSRQRINKLLQAAYQKLLKAAKAMGMEMEI